MPKGLSALIPSNRPSTSSGDNRGKAQSMSAAMDMNTPESRDKIWQIPVAKIIPNAQQPRVFFDPQKLQGMVASIRTYGILQPLVVTPREGGAYEIVAGERRFRAARELGLKTVPAIIREAKELEKLELALIENIQREDL
ncbi:MAG: ParB/RepB/Spo0J family partition protein, partial [bacterium]|nr:ParB/RepB/Spo0J family partition protein [bacterium]